LWIGSVREATSGPFQCPDWVRNELNDWLVAAAIDRGKLFRRVNKVGKTWGEDVTEKAVWQIVKESARTAGISKFGAA
jgi:hypothetical protein